MAYIGASHKLAKMRQSIICGRYDSRGSDQECVPVTVKLLDKTVAS
jgi:hypothetical protein